MLIVKTVFELSAAQGEKHEVIDISSRLWKREVIDLSKLFLHFHQLLRCQRSAVVKFVCKGGDNDNLHYRKVADWDRHFSCNQISWGVHCTASELLRPILRGHIGNVFLSIRVVDDWEWYISWDDNLWTAINWLHSVLQCWKQITRSPEISKQ